METKTAVHIVDNYLLNPANPVTVNLIGAGGTGSRMITTLAETNYSLIQLGHPGLHVQLFDDDVVTEANLIKQRFAPSELGLNKAVARINNINRACGTNWKAVPEKFTSQRLKDLPEEGLANVYITCVDTVQARFDIAGILKGFSRKAIYGRDKPLYWLDTGNARYTGQALLSTIGEIKQPASQLYQTVSVLQMVTDEYKNLLEAETDNNEPSCSHAEAILKQDLFINPAIAIWTASLFYSLFREGMVAYRGFFINLKEFRSTPIRV